MNLTPSIPFGSPRRPESFLSSEPICNPWIPPGVPHAPPKSTKIYFIKYLCYYMIHICTFSSRINQLNNALVMLSIFMKNKYQKFLFKIQSLFQEKLVWKLSSLGRWCGLSVTSYTCETLACLPISGCGPGDHRHHQSIARSDTANKN